MKKSRASWKFLTSTQLTKRGVYEIICGEIQDRGLRPTLFGLTTVGGYVLASRTITTYAVIARNSWNRTLMHVGITYKHEREEISVYLGTYQISSTELLSVNKLKNALKRAENKTHNWLMKQREPYRLASEAIDNPDYHDLLRGTV